MLARINTVSFEGVSVRAVDVQVQMTSGLPAFTIVGLPDKAVAESRERVRGALHAMGLSIPPKRLTVNLAPADLAKEGSHYDLPIALGLLAAMGVVPADAVADCVVLGELALDSTIRAVAGVLPAAVHAGSHGGRLICPSACGAEAAWAGSVDILAPDNLLQLINHIKGTQIMVPPEAALGGGEMVSDRHIPDMGDVRGQETAKRALEIAAAGAHNLLMVGPPGAGKSMLAACLPGILPPLSPREALEVSMIHSLAGSLPDGGLVRTRPFRDPHHSASLPSLVGGGQKARPGEISLAHHGVLFLDELPEFARATLESLRQPLETGRAVIARANHHVTYPARFQLIAAMNPCRCGHFGDEALACHKAPRCAADYQAKLSGPLLDRIDMQVDVNMLPIAALSAPPDGERSAVIAGRILRARRIQQERNAGLDGGDPARVLNADLGVEALAGAAPLQEDADKLLQDAAQQLKLSARAYHRLLRVARTIADLEGGPDLIARHHIAEALSYRRMRVM